MSWDPDADTPPEQRHDAVSPIAIAVALAVPLLLLSRLFPQFA
jgi:hypothetical protein